jgi:hypothetical protein
VQHGSWADRLELVGDAEDLGLNNWPSRFWTINVTWTQILALAPNLLACYRHLALPDGDLRDAARGWAALPRLRLRGREDRRPDVMAAVHRSGTSSIPAHLGHPPNENRDY